VSPILDSIGSVKGFGFGAFVSVPNSFESIATVTVSTATPTISFTSTCYLYSFTIKRNYQRC
jgi:hypothetical protein